MGIGSPGVPRPLSHLLLLLLLLEESRGFPPGTHTLRYDLMALSLHRPGKPQFLALGYFDDEVFLRYDGESQRAEPQGLGIKMDLGAETWERETKDLKEKERQLRQMLTEIMGQQGQGSGLHSLQATLGCELQGDSTRGSWRLGYNGQDQDFLTFYSQTLTWTLATPSAQRIKKLWETQDPRADLVETFLHVTCPAQLWRYLASWRGLQENTDPPSVTVTRSKNLLGKVILRCWAFSFYPRGAILTWLRDGEPMHQGTFGPGVSLPSGDGTYQTWVDTWILPGEEQVFTCHVGHCGLNTTIPAVSGPQGQSASCAAAPAAAPLAVSTVAAVLYLVVVEA
ncbi:MHC class I-like protein MILL1 isoform X1 [Diceros bicornis minor]|nr:MHC class I-like protein MILL1 isoform X1 [Diceros bicornis minor]XP_058385622.1 MHC class I-like protein MILL1 isoform X1 [Diceros bicornis minor]XP_058385623.1 MHC class I-like protein MILL1 isoform X1 [Diceros bicornis minor]XP_058385624.1 MHC class I-like protein MILL1 isoform X1 [Diceros bicornis minor]